MPRPDATETAARKGIGVADGVRTGAHASGSCAADTFLLRCPNHNQVAAQGLRWLADALRSRAAKVDGACTSARDGQVAAKLNTTTISDKLGCTYHTLNNRARADGYRYGLAVRWVKFLFSLPHLCAGTTQESLGRILGVENYSDFVRTLTGERPSAVAKRIEMRTIEQWIGEGQLRVFGREAGHAGAGQLNGDYMEWCLRRMRGWIEKDQLEWDIEHLDDERAKTTVGKRMRILRETLLSEGGGEGADMFLETMQACVTAMVHARVMLSRR